MALAVVLDTDLRDAINHRQSLYDFVEVVHEVQDGIETASAAEIARPPPAPVKPMYRSLAAMNPTAYRSLPMAEQHFPEGSLSHSQSVPPKRAGGAFSGDGSYGCSSGGHEKDTPPTSSGPPMMVETWSVAEVGAFLSKVGLHNLGENWAKPNCIDGAVLLDLVTHDSLDATLGSPPTNLLYGARIRAGLSKYGSKAPTPVPGEPLPPSPAAPASPTELSGLVALPHCSCSEMRSIATASSPHVAGACLASGHADENLSPLPAVTISDELPAAPSQKLSKRGARRKKQREAVKSFAAASGVPLPAADLSPEESFHREIALAVVRSPTAKALDNEANALINRAHRSDFQASRQLDEVRAALRSGEITQLWGQHAEAEMFGSRACGMYMESSGLDILVKAPREEWQTQKPGLLNELETLKTVLETSAECKDSSGTPLSSFRGAKFEIRKSQPIPILMLIDPPEGVIPMEISIHGHGLFGGAIHDGLRVKDLMETIKNDIPQVKTIGVVLKQLLQGFKLSALATILIAAAFIKARPDASWLPRSEYRQFPLFVGLLSYLVHRFDPRADSIRVMLERPAESLEFVALDESERCLQVRITDIRQEQKNVATSCKLSQGLRGEDCWSEIKEHLGQCLNRLLEAHRLERHWRIFPDSLGREHNFPADKSKSQPTYRSLSAAGRGATIEEADKDLMMYRSLAASVLDD